MTFQAPQLSRRAFTALVMALVVPAARAHDDELGLLEPPRPVPPLPLTLHDGRRSGLQALLRGRTTALQLMFTGCSAICPLQGAVFARLQGLVLGRVPGAQLLSVSIDPLSDNAAALAAWRARFGAREDWIAAAPPVAQNTLLPEFVSPVAAAKARRSDPHTAQVMLIDKQARLAYRCADLASADDIAKGMEQLARL